MKKIKITLSFAFFLCIAMSQVVRTTWGAENLVKTQEYEIEASNQQYQKKNIFDDVIQENGNFYKLIDIRYELKEEKPVTKKEVSILTKTSDAILDRQEYLPEEKVVEDGISYTLEDTSKQETQISSEYRQLVIGEDIYDYEVTKSSIPEIKRIAAIDQQTNEPVEVTCRLVSLEKRSESEQKMKFPIIYYNYGSDFYSYGDALIPYEEEKPALAGYEHRLLEDAGYNVRDWTVVDIVWDGEAYDNQGILQRNAIAICEGNQVHYRARYEGYIKKAAQKAYYYTSVYKGEKETAIQGKMLYKIKAKAIYELQADKKVITSTEKLMIGLGVIASAAILILIIYILAKKRREH